MRLQLNQTEGMIVHRALERFAKEVRPSPYSEDNASDAALDVVADTAQEIANRIVELSTAEEED